jgi:hypothetical protein
MSTRSLLALSLALTAASFSCSSISTDGSGTNNNTNTNPNCLPDGTCAQPGTNPQDPYNVPTRSGSTSAGGTSGTPLDPKSTGSTGVTTDPAGAIAIDLSGFKNAGAPYIWIANSSEGTESKVDVNTNLEVGRYCTYRGCNGDPSRSTVSLQGDVVVANRAAYYGINAPARASAVKIAGDKSRCVDRNGNGKIDTFEGAGKIPAQFIWQATQQDSPDECVLWLTDLSKDKNGNVVNTLPRAATFDSTIGADGTLSKYVYIGLYNTGEVLRLDSETGAVLKRIQLSGIAPYGMVTDKDGNLWIRGGNLTKIDVKNNDALTAYTDPCGYGITADSRGYIYTASGGCVARFDPANPGKGWETYSFGGGSGRGLALDSKFNLWVADTCNGMYHIDASKPHGMGMSTLKLVSPRGVTCTSYYLGIGLDKNEQPWVVSEGSNNLGTPASGANDPSGRIYHVNPADYSFTAVTVGNNPYTYSDMTGAQLRIAGSPFGIYRHTFKSDCAPAKTTWTSVTYDLVTPAGTSVDISARGAGDLTTLNTALFGPAVSIPPSVAGPYTPSINEGVDNTYLQLQFKLNSSDPTKTPTVNNLKATFICG